MTLSYEEIFSDFLGRVTDYEMMSKDDTQVYMMMTECLHKVFKKPYIRRLFASVSLDDEVHDITFEMKNVVSEDEDLDFVQEIASKGMVVEWLEP